jgi:hypothetical protein
MKHRFASLLTLLGLVGIGCSGPTEPVAIATIQVTAPSTTLASGGTVQLTATTLSKDGKALTDRMVTWSSSNQAVATVSTTGLVTAGLILKGKPDTVNIIAQVEDLRSVTTLIVTEVKAEQLRLSVNNIEVIAGQTANVSAVVYGLNGSTVLDRQVKWITTDTSVIQLEPQQGSVKISVSSYQPYIPKTVKLIATVEALSDTTQVQILPEFINIPDAEFAGALTRLGYPVTNGLMRTTVAQSITQFCISSKYGEGGYRPPEGGPYTGLKQGSYIRSADGIQYFRNLQTFRLENQQLSSIDLSSLKELKKISLWENPITSLDVSQNTKLTLLGLSETSIQNIDLAALTELEEINFQHGGSGTLPYTTSNGTIVYGFKKIDLTKNTKIQRIYIMRNAVEDSMLILPSNRQLTDFWASENRFKRLDFSNYPNLTHVIVENNDLDLLDIRSVAQAWGGLPLRVYTQGNPRLLQIRVTNVDGMNARAALSNGGVFIDSWTKFVP